MKRVIVSFFVVLLFASCLSAQRNARRVLDGGSGIGVSHLSLDLNDPFSPFYTRAESNRPSTPASPRPVSVSQLRIPSKAMKEFERARKAFQSGEIRASAEHLEKAVRIYPDFVEAHNALGRRFV